MIVHRYKNYGIEEASIQLMTKTKSGLNVIVTYSVPGTTTVEPQSTSKTLKRKELSISAIKTTISDSMIDSMIDFASA